MDVAIAPLNSTEWQTLAFTPDYYVHAQDHQENFTTIVVSRTASFHLFYFFLFGKHCTESQFQILGDARVSIPISFEKKVKWSCKNWAKKTSDSLNRFIKFWIRLWRGIASYRLHIYRII